ncbi:MAG: ABC transporter transmembrane domain-containing protein [Oscillospiraceae bacterium]
MVRAFGRERYEDEKFNAKNQRFSQLWIRLGKLLSVYWASGTLLTCLQVMVIVVTGACECVAGRMTLGTFVAFVTYNEALSWPVRSLGRVLSDMSKAGVSMDRVGYILNAREEQDAPDAVDAADGDIVFDHVTFGYHGQPVLRGRVLYHSPRARPLPFWGAPAPARAPWCTCWTGCMTCRRAAAPSPSAGWTSAA